MRKNIYPFILALAGLAIAAGGFFANRLGVSTHADWRAMRVMIVVVGVFIFITPIAFSLFGSRITILISGIELYVKKSYAAIRPYSYTFPLVALVLVVYVWVVSAGTWTTWHSPSKYYADLARGFLSGSLHLASHPDPELLKLPNPYDFHTWGMIPVLLDASLYQGEYYLYWGPTPALILVLFSPLIGDRVGDIAITFGFIMGVFLLLYILCLVIWDRFFRDLPRSILLLSILFLGLAGPMTFALENKVSARVYEAAIAGGQFFLIGGFLLLLFVLRRAPVSILGLMLVGVLWALAIASRLILALPIAGLVIMGMLRMYHFYTKDWKAILQRLVVLGVPLGLAFIGLGWYNWARFGSITETGLYYQLAGTDLKHYYKELLMPGFVLQNIYNYFLLSFHTETAFPFIHSVLGLRAPIFSWYSFPSVYNAQHVTGLVYMAPFSIFALFSLGMRPRQQLLWDKDEWNFLLWIMRSLGVSSLLAVGTLLLYFWSAMRFQLDFTPSFFLLSVISFWRGYRAFDHFPKRQKVFFASGVILALVSVTISVLLTIGMGSLAVSF